ncbi:GNAT family N-acetyltransferase [Algoriphagus yeomjeoni]|uniref:GNAT family N-acetyltransferase n=1 Tax=Algoriphagus yeomjeoni TaxID=291403 RepID=UPI003CE5234A
MEATKDYQLIYLFTKSALEISSPAIQMVDTKITFQKTLTSIEKSEEIQNYENPTLEDELLDLAYLSGEYSRFRIDPRLRQEEFQKLYKLWIQKAWEAKQLLIAPNRAGMVTYTHEKDQGAIGLIAVSEDHQGQGLGKKLVKAAEYKCYQEGAKEMLIPTQESNTPACKLYESLGYTPAELAYVYHWWKS